MNHIKVNDVVSVKHYSGINPFKSIVVGIDGDVVRVKLTKDFTLLNFLEGDPLVFGVESDGEVYMVGSNIVNIDSKEGIVEAVIDKFESGSEQRMYERFPVSLYSDVRTKLSKKKHLAIVKDISFYGLLIYCKSDFSINEQIEVDIYMEKTMVFLKGEIMRKKQGTNYIEYGLRILYEDANSMYFIKDYLKRLKDSQEESIRKIKESNW